MIISFYSYKGGVGRTQLAANLASYFCYQKDMKILLIDWDLEAPGLHYYFKKDNIQNKGLIDLFIEFKNKFKHSPVIEEANLPKIEDEYIVNLVSTSTLTKGCIDLVTAGYYDKTLKEYNRKINSFNWSDFYDKLSGSTYIEILKKQLKSLDYDFIFIDSRTGVSDYSGIANIQMPDVNVLIVAPTTQNFAGTFRIAENIKNAPYIKKEYRKPLIMPILSRVDLSIEHKSNDWLSAFQDKFNDYINHICNYINVDNESYLADTLLDYKRDLSFGEQILFNTRLSKINTKTLAKQYKLIANYLLKIKNPETVIISDEETLQVEKYAHLHKKVFVFGNKGTGKTTLIASLLSYFYSSERVLFRMDLENADGSKYIWELINWQRDNFTNRVNPDAAFQKIDFAVEFTNSDLKEADKNKEFTFFDFKGEDLLKFDINKEGGFDKTTIHILKNTTDLLLVATAQTATADDQIISSFFNYCVTLNIRFQNVALIINNFDPKGKIDPEDIIKNMPQTLNWLRSKYVGSSTMRRFSIDKFDLYTADIAKWLLLDTHLYKKTEKI